MKLEEKLCCLYLVEGKVFVSVVNDSLYVPGPGKNLLMYSELSLNRLTLEMKPLPNPFLENESVYRSIWLRFC